MRTSLARRGEACERDQAHALPYHLNVPIPEAPAAACYKLRELAGTEPMQSTIRLVAHALTHPKEGVQVCAAQTLAAWRAHAAVPPLRSWFRDVLSRRYSWAPLGKQRKRWLHVSTLQTLNGHSKCILRTSQPRGVSISSPFYLLCRRVSCKVVSRQNCKVSAP